MGTGLIPPHTAHQVETADTRRCTPIFVGSIRVNRCASAVSFLFLSLMVVVMGALSLVKREGDCLFRARGHEVVAGVIRKQSVTGQFFPEIPGLGQRRIVVEIDRTA